MELDDAAAAQFVQLPVRCRGVHGPVDAGDAHACRRAVEAVVEGERGARRQSEGPRGGLRHGGLGLRAGALPGHPPLGDPHLGRVQRGEVREVGLVRLRAFARWAQGGGQGVGAGTGQGAQRHRQPVEDLAGGLAHGGVGGGAAVLGHLGLDGERGVGGVAGVGQGVPQRCVADGGRVGGESGQHRRGQQDREQRGGEEGAVGACAGEDKTYRACCGSHSTPRGCPDLRVMLSEDAGRG